MGVNSVQEEITKRGMLGEKTPTPNTRLEYAEVNQLLKSAFVKESGDGVGKRILARLEDKPKEEPKSEAQEPKAEEEKPKRGLTILGNINDMKAPKEEKPKAEAKPKKEEPKKVEVKAEEVKPTEVKAPAKPKSEEKKSEPVKPAKVEAPKQEVKEESPVVVEEPKAEAKTDDGVYRPSTPNVGVEFKVVGKIDLSAINDSTRPAKKSNKERKEERKKRQRVKEAVDVKAEAAKIGNNQGKRQGNNANHSANNQAKKNNNDHNGANKSEGGKQNNNARHDNNKQKGGNKKDHKAKGQPNNQPSDEDVQRQVKETLARLTGKNNQNKGAKYRKDKRDAARAAAAEAAEAAAEESRVLKLTEFVTVSDLANMMDVPVTKVIGTCMTLGLMVSINMRLDAETIDIVAEEFGFKTDFVSAEVAETLSQQEEVDDEADLESRPPIVTVMGHVDHGKTSLLDRLRNTNVIAGEAGGITQHIGAYSLKLQNGKRITFLDTPGHEAFTAMRMRGAQATDIAVLVVAADDGVMPQTVEAINHAKAAGVEIIVAINKIDRPAANIDKVKQELSEYELIPEDWGGSTIFVPVSAKTGEGISNLLEMIILTAEVKELKANPNRKARGLVIEAELDKGKGPVARILVQKGTLHVGDFIAAGACSGKVRAMMNDKGVKVKSAGPSTPVEILGLDSVPNAGEVFVATENDKEAKAFAATFISESKNKLIEDTKAKLSLDDLFSQIKAGNVKELPIVVKADVQGSVEAVKQSLTKLSNEEVAVKVIHGGVGAINESDVVLAAASNAIIIGFNVKPDQMAKATAERENVDLRLYRVIYQAIEDIESAMKGMLEPIYEEKVIGHAEIRQIFKASGVGNIAGSYVLDGKFVRGCKVRITRDGEQIFDGNLASLKRFKDDVKEVATGYECGLVFEKFNDIKEFDQVEAYAMVEVPRS